MFHMYRELTYSIMAAFFLYDQEVELVQTFYLCVCIGSINSWERNIKGAYMIADLSIYPCKSDNFLYNLSFSYYKYINLESFCLYQNDKWSF